MPSVKMWHKMKKEHEKSTRTAIPVLVFKIIAVVILDGNPLLLLKRISEIRTMTTARSHSLGTIVKFFYIVVKTGIGLKSLCVCCYSYAKRFFLSQNWMQEPV